MIASGAPLVGFLLSATTVISGSGPAPVRPIESEPLQYLQRWMPGDIRCGNHIIPAAVLRRPYTSLQWTGASATPQTYRFQIGERGYPILIERVSTEGAPGTEDLAPSLAASRLEAGRTGNRCEVTYAADPKPLSDAPVSDLMSYSLMPLSGPLPEAGWARIRPAGGDCDREPRANWLVAVSPDYQRLPAAPGVRDWSMLGYDLDAAGRPVAVRHVTGTGNRALDRAALDALTKSRQSEGPRRGCLNPYVRQANRLPAPPDIDPETLRPDGATCIRNGDWAKAPVLHYPDNWRRRSIEGWAIVAFDVAPWGEPGNVRAVASAPSDEFGAQAVRIVATARKPASTTGYTGCVERVRFVMGPGTVDMSQSR